jgi:AraC-like DNA-binding protein
MAAIEGAPLDRVTERKRAVLLARHYREAEGLTIIQIAQRLGRSPATVKAYFYDPDGDKAKAVKRRYQGTCRSCGAATQARNGKNDPYEYCKACGHAGPVPLRCKSGARALAPSRTQPLAARAKPVSTKPSGRLDSALGPGSGPTAKFASVANLSCQPPRRASSCWGSSA